MNETITQSMINSSEELTENVWKKQMTKFKKISNHEIVHISHVKRFMERWKADPDFRTQVSTEPAKAVERYDLKVNPKEIRPLWDLKVYEEFSEEVPIYGSLKLWQKFVEENRINPLMKSLAASSSNPHFKEWRERQMARTTRQFPKSDGDAIVHSIVCFELSKGCSVGCCFCGVSAARLSNVFVYNQENKKLWREVLEVIKKILGPAAATGFCYWATDPLDNPDYEKFCCDFYTALGIFPPFTTSQPLKDPARTRSLLKLSREKGGLPNRFSILSLKMLNQVHTEFSAEELAFVKLELLNEEANTIKANSGRARERNLKKGEKDSDILEPGTIACVTGFLFNMVDQSVKLISPCNADDRWPLGYIIYDEGTFSDADDLKILLEKMIAHNMPFTVRPSDLISFPRDIKYESLPDGFQLSTKFKNFKFRNEPYLRELGEIIHKNGKTAEEIAFLFELRGISPVHTFNTLNLLFKKGVLDDEPKPKSSAQNFENSEF